MPEFFKFLSKKMEEVSFTTLFLFIFGAVLMVTGTTEKIAILGQSFVIKDEFRWIILVVGIVFILTGIAKERLPIEGTLNGNGPIKMPPLYTFHGLEENLRSDAVFQDFVIDRSGGTNRNAVYYMWTDTFKQNTIQASIESNDNDNSFLQVIFNNKSGWLSNIAIHPMNEQALDNQNDSKLKYRFLKILARVPREVLGFSPKVGITLRICDRNLTYWEYANKPGEFIQLPILIDGWQKQYVDLEDNRLWHKFKSDGNYKNPASIPDFSVISGIVLIFGGFNPGETTPACGEGIVDIRKISLENHPVGNY